MSSWFFTMEETVTIVQPITSDEDYDKINYNNNQVRYYTTVTKVRK
jgi:hypothetical protein